MTTGSHRYHAILVPTPALVTCASRPSPPVRHQWESCTLSPSLRKGRVLVSVDFISKLLDAHGYNVIMVIMDKVEKRAHFIPTTTTCSALGAVNLYCKNV